MFVRTIIISLLLLGSYAVSGQSLDFIGTDVGYFDNGDVKYERYADSSGKYIGQWVDYSAPGQVRGSIDFDKGIAIVHHSREGTIRTRITFCTENMMNRQGGLYEEWWPNGQKKFEGYYIGRPHLFSGSRLTAGIYGKKEIINYYKKDGQIDDKKVFPNKKFHYDVESKAPETVDFQELENLNGIYYWKDDPVPFNGQTEGFHPNGVKAFSTPVKNGKKMDVQSQTWWDTGIPKVIRKRSYTEDVTQYMAPNGTVRREIDHKNNLETHYFDNGNTKTISAMYKHRRVVFKQWDPNGNLLMDGQVHEGMQVGQWKKFRKGQDGKMFLAIEENYKDGYLEGDYRSYHSADTLAEAGQYEFGRKEGTWTYYNAEGILMRSVQYKFDERHGICKLMHSNGKLQYEMTYKREKLDGPMSIYDEEGKLLAKLKMKLNKIEEVLEQAEGYYLVSGVISHYYPHCGGAYGEGRTFMGGTLFVRDGNKNDPEKQVIQKVNSVEGGRYFVMLKPGTYCFIKNNKLEITSLTNYLTKDHGQYYTSRGDSCYEQWFYSCDGTLELTNTNVLDLHFQSSDRCFTGDDPCLNYHGPYPP